MQSAELSEFVSRVLDSKLAQTILESLQSKMKKCFEGDKVLVLLLIQGAALRARFSGPYIIDKK